MAQINKFVVIEWSNMQVHWAVNGAVWSVGWPGFGFDKCQLMIIRNNNHKTYFHFFSILNFCALGAAGDVAHWSSEEKHHFEIVPGQQIRIHSVCFALVFDCSLLGFRVRMDARPISPSDITIQPL